MPAAGAETGRRAGSLLEQGECFRWGGGDSLTAMQYIAVKAQRTVLLKWASFIIGKS